MMDRITVFLYSILGPWERIFLPLPQRCLQGSLLNLYPNKYNSVKPICFLGDSLQCLKDLPLDARQDAGYQLDKVQRGGQPDDFKPMPTIGKGVEEIRIWDESDTYRVIYTARLADAVFVLHVFQKKTQATPRQHIETADDAFSK